MKYFLDTNVISFLMKRDGEMTRRFRELMQTPDTEVVIPVVAYYEVKRGLSYSGASTKMRLFKTITSMMSTAQLTQGACDIAAEVYADLRSRGILIEDADIFIAASAMECGATLVTKNGKHMERIAGLTVEAWG